MLSYYTSDINKDLPDDQRLQVVVYHAYSHQVVRCSLSTLSTYKGNEKMGLNESTNTILIPKKGWDTLSDHRQY